MTARGRRTRAQLQGVSTADMTPAEYERSDTPGRYRVTTPAGTIIKTTSLHSAKVLAGTTGAIENEES